MVHSLSFPSCTQPPPCWVLQTPLQKILATGLQFMYLCLQALILHNSMERETQKRQGDNRAVSQTLESLLLHVDTMGELAGEKQTKIHAKISTKTSGTLSSWMRISWANHSCQKFYAHIYSVTQNLWNIGRVENWEGEH